jgi:hypothetical protein
MGWIWCVCCENIRRNIVARTCALIAPVRPILHRSSSCNWTIQNAPKHGFRVQCCGSGVFCCKKFRRDNVARTCALMAPVRPVLHPSSYSNETVQNIPKHEFWGPMGCISCVHCEKFRCDTVACTCALMTPIHPDLHRNLFSNGMFRIIPKHKFGVQ